MRIVVLAGGLSPERDVSLCSGSLISNALIDKGHEVALIDLYYGLSNLDELKYQSLSTNVRYHYEIPSQAPDLEELILKNYGRTIPIGENVLEACLDADVVFLALHGGMGENGEIQAVLDSYGISYTGSDYIGCALAMDKGLSKVMLRDHHIQTPYSKSYDIDASEEEIINEVSEYPCVIKPIGCGSSIGVSIVYNKDEMKQALKNAKTMKQPLLVEKYIKGREFSVSVLGGEALPPIEIIPKSGFYDYKNKYQADATIEICPANLTSAQESKMKKTAEAVHKALRLKSYSRTDIIMDEHDECWVLEANNLPGMTPNSLLPQEARAVGIAYEDLCDRIVHMALEK